MAAGDYILNTYSFIHDASLVDRLDQAAGHGFRRVELMAHPGHFWPSQLDAAGRRAVHGALERGGIDVVALNQPNVDLNLAAEADELRTATVDAVRRVVELAGEFGAPAVQIGPGKVNPLHPSSIASAIERFVRSLDALVPVAERAGTALLVENMPFAFLPDARGMIAALDGYGASRLGVTYDIANGAFIGEDPVEGLAIVGDRLRMVHVSDTTRAVYRHDPVGAGDIDFAAALAAVRGSGWTGQAVLEIIATGDDPWAPILRSVERLDELGWPELAADVA